MRTHARTHTHTHTHTVINPLIISDDYDTVLMIIFPESTCQLELRDEGDYSVKTTVLCRLSCFSLSISLDRTSLLRQGDWERELSTVRPCLFLWEKKRPLFYFNELCSLRVWGRDEVSLYLHNGERCLDWVSIWQLREINTVASPGRDNRPW